MMINARVFVWLPLLTCLACGESDSSTDSEEGNTTTSASGADETSTATEATTTDPDPATSKSDGPDDPEVTEGVTSVGARCDRATRLGSLSINLGKDRTIVAGAVSNGVLPSSVPEVQMASGGCELLVPRDLFCTSCSAGEACAGDDACVPKPSKVSAGAVSIEGLLLETEVTPNGLTLDYSKTILDPYPAYDIGQALTLHASGDVTEAFEANVYGVPQLVSDLPIVAVKQGEATLLEWNAENVVPEQTSVFISFSVNVHGAVTGWIECTAPDTGSFEIPAPMVSALIDLGLSGFPRVDLERRSSATVGLEAGCVDVYAGSKLTLEIEVDGLSSCNEDGDCPDGQTCSEELACE